MPGCVFCQIVAGEIPCQKVWEDDNYLAFLDIKQDVEGHTLLIPKKHYRWVWDVEDFSGYFEKVKEVEKLLENKFKPEFVEARVFGMDVAHAHVQLIPHYGNKAI